MATELRKTGMSVVGDVAWGTHFCQFYETKQDLLDILVPYFKAGLESKEFCLWVVSNAGLITVEEAKGALERAVPDFDRHLSEKNIEILNEHDWYLEENVFNLERVLSAWDTKLKRALALGYDGMRAAGDTFWLGENVWKDFCAYEKHINNYITDRPMTLLCTYPLAKSGAAEVLDVVESHQFAIARRQGEWKVIETPELIQAKSEITRLNEELEQRVVERTDQLAKTIEKLTAEISDRKQSEVELSLAHQRLSYHVENTPLAVIEWDKELFIKRWSKRAEEVFGWKASEALGINLYDPDFPIIYEEDAQAVEEIAAHLMKGTVNRNLSLNRNYTKDGNVIYCEWYNSVLRDEDGNIITILSLVHDVTERKQAEEHLKQSESQLAEAQHLARVGSWNWDLQSNTLNWSDELYRISGVDPLVYNPVYEEFVMEFAHPEDRALVRGVIESSLKTQKPFSFSYRILRPDSEERVIHARGNIVSNEHGNPIRIFGTAQDVTERKQAEEALRRAEQKYRDIFENAGEGIFQSTPGGRYIAVNPTLARMYRFASPEELIHNRQDISRQVYVDPTRREEFKRQVEEQGAVRGFEHEVYRKDGSRLWISVNARAVKDAQGAIQYYEGTAQDITERKAAEEQLKASSEQLRALSASLQSAREEEGARIGREIHDELGAALTSLRWDLESVDKAISQAGDQSQFQLLRERIESMIRLTDTTIGAVRRISAELRPSVLDDLGLVAAIEWQAEQFQVRTGIICRCDCSLENLDLSREQSTAVFRILQEALTNILRHAQATSVDITTKAEAGEFVLAIIDNGRGISENEKSGSQSLGLLGMQERAHLIGGKINITGVEGEGTVITVRVPIPG